MSPVQEADFCFVVIDPENRSVELEIRPYEVLARQHFQGVWQRLSAALQKHHELGKATPSPGWTTWKQRRTARTPGWRIIAVPEMKFVDFKPKWMQNLSDEDRRILQWKPVRAGNRSRQFKPRGGDAART